MTQSDQSAVGNDHRTRMEKLRIVMKSSQTIEFVSFLAVFIPLFFAIAELLKAFDVSIPIALAVGMLFSKAITPVSRWFAERYARRVRGLNVDAE